MSDLNHLMDHAADDYGGWRVLLAAQGKRAALAYLSDHYTGREGCVTELVGEKTLRLTVTLTDEELDLALAEAKSAGAR